MKVLISCRQLGSAAGGVERMAIWLANQLAERGNEVSLVTWDQASADTFYPLLPDVNWVRLDIGQIKAKSSWKIRVLRLLKIRRLLKDSKIEVGIGFQHGVFWNLLVASLGLSMPVIAAERNSPARFSHTREGRIKYAVFLSFLFAKRVTIQQHAFALLYPKFLSRKISVIENPVYVPATQASPQVPFEGRYRVLTVGRLSYQKNPMCLLTAFQLISEQFPDWDLVFVGSGELHSDLLRSVEKLDLRDRVFFTGAINETESEYLKASLFCMSSRWEGFPNALAEAMSFGLPCLGFSHCSGVRELICDRQTGLLSEGNGDEVTLSERLSELMRDHALRADLGESARLSMSAYSPESTIDKWVALLDQCVSKP